jgi:hypothetical protein
MLTYFLLKNPELLQYPHKHLFERAFTKFYLAKMKNGHFKNVQF